MFLHISYSKLSKAKLEVDDMFEHFQLCYAISTV